MSTPVKHHSPGFVALVAEAKKHIQEIDIEEYKRLRESGNAGQLVDVREDHEWELAHAAGAIHMSRGTIERDIEVALPGKEVKLILYCGGGYRSALVTESLGKMGYTNIISLDGGWRAIEASGLPLERKQNLSKD